jgi:hypothetical protein
MIWLDVSIQLISEIGNHFKIDLLKQMKNLFSARTVIIFWESLYGLEMIAVGSD